MPVTFIYRKDTIYASSVTILKSADEAINLRFRSHEEHRFPLTFSWGCSAGDCIQVANVTPRWTINLTGTDAQGHAVQAVIKIHLPANPETYQKPKQPPQPHDRFSRQGVHSPARYSEYSVSHYVHDTVGQLPSAEIGVPNLPSLRAKKLKK